MIGRLAETGIDVAREADPDGMDLTERAGFDHLLGLLDALPVAPLRPHHHDAVIFARGLHHPLTFVDEYGHRLLDVNILARRAGHDRGQRMPVVRGRDDNALDILVLVHLPEIAVALGMGVPGVRQACLQAGLVTIADPNDVGFGAQFLEVGDVLLADQAEADEADADAFVRAEHAAVRCRRQRGRPNKRAPCRSARRR